jgi:hypothetical protein
MRRWCPNLTEEERRILIEAGEKCTSKVNELYISVLHPSRTYSIILL